MSISSITPLLQIVTNTHARKALGTKEHSEVTFQYVNAQYLSDILTSSLAAHPLHRALHIRLAGKKLGSLHGLESWECTQDILQSHVIRSMKSTSSRIVRVTFLRIATEIKTRRNAAFSGRSELKLPRVWLSQDPTRCQRKRR